MSDEEKEIFNNLKDYMQNNIDNGYHKFIYNDLDWDFKCIDCINAIENVLNLIEKQSKEIEEYKKQLDLNYVDKHFVPVERYNQLEKQIEDLKQEKEYLNCIIESDKDNYINKNKIKAKIEELNDGIKRDMINHDKLKDESWKLAIHRSMAQKIEIKKVLQSLLEE